MRRLVRAEWRPDDLCGLWLPVGFRFLLSLDLSVGHKSPQLLEGGVGGLDTRPLRLVSPLDALGAAPLLAGRFFGDFSDHFRCLC